MGAATTDFFEELSHRGHEPLLETTTGTIRVDLMKSRKQSERWLLSIAKGDIDVSHRNAKADCTMRVPEALFDGMASGEVNPLAAMLRGVVGFEGNPTLLVRLQRLFPSPPRKAPSRTARRGRKP
jgi:putative sterol carrier protein